MEDLLLIKANVTHITWHIIDMTDTAADTALSLWYSFFRFFCNSLIQILFVTKTVMRI